MAVRFRPLADDDLSMLHRWLNDPEVVRWWEGDDVSWDGVVGQYGAAARRLEPEEHWIASIDERDIGWIQCYASADSPEEAESWWPLGIDRTAAGIDYLVGEPGDRGRGLGSAMIRTFVHEVVFGQHSGWTQACASPLDANVASWRALERAGFRFIATFDDTLGPCRLMAIDRPSGGLG